MNRAHERLCGVDEAGRGALAGPVYAAAVILNPRRPIPGLRDSKKLSPAQRERLAQVIRENALAWAVAHADVAEIARLNILHASLLAMRRAILALTARPDRIVVDGNRCPGELPAPATALVRGDALEPAISAASILAKVARDAEMRRSAALYPGYGFERHAGYSTPEHLAALDRLGPSLVHRLEFAPLRRILERRGLAASHKENAS